jgi:nucleotide-binding universal stress UspA family protein
MVDFDRLQLQNSFDLIVVPNKKKNLLSRVFNPGLAHRLLFHADIPMLVIPV